MHSVFTEYEVSVLHQLIHSLTINHGNLQIGWNWLDHVNMVEITVL